MRIVCPRTQVIPEVVEALDATEHPWEPVDLTHPEHYFDLLSELWAAGETFAIVEHDIVVDESVVDELEWCPHPWCAFPYRYLYGYHHGLGCVRFHRDILRRHPKAMSLVGAMSDEGHPPKHYCRLDGWLRTVLSRRGESMHQHWQMVTHLQSNPGHSGHGCV